MNQSFSVSELLKLLRGSELAKYEMGMEELVDSLQKACEKIANGLPIFGIVVSNGICSVSSLAETLIIRKLYDNIWKIYKERQSNREVIVRQIEVLMGEKVPYWIFRSDISKFYESIDRNRLFDKLRDDGVLSSWSIKLIQEIFSHLDSINYRGLPKGIAISAILSELYLRQFDRFAKRFEGAYYYARFVDDFILFFASKEYLRAFEGQLSSESRAVLRGLSLNEKKTITRSREDLMLEGKSIDFLGYNFGLCPSCNSVVVKISLSKLKKIKSKLALSFLNYYQYGDFLLLVNRIKFLTGNFHLRRNREGTSLRAGIYYNYQNINDFTGLIELDQVLRYLTHARKLRISSNSRFRLSGAQVGTLSKYSFAHGYKLRVLHMFSFQELSKITSVWK